jgi:hypothetical protein
MALRKRERSLEDEAPLADVGSTVQQQGRNPAPLAFTDKARLDRSSQTSSAWKQSQPSPLQTLLSWVALHEQLNKRKAWARHADPDGGPLAVHLEEVQQFELDEALQLIADRAMAITGANGAAIALAENNEIVLRAAAGAMRPGIGTPIGCNSLFSGACLRMAQIVSCEDTEIDTRVSLEACRNLGVRSMVALPLFSRHRVIGLLETFSALPFGFSEGDIGNLKSLAELINGAMNPEDEDRFAESARIALARLEPEDKAKAIGASGMGVHDSEEAAASEPWINGKGGRTRLGESKSIHRPDILLLLVSLAITAGLAAAAWRRPRTNGSSKEVVKQEKLRTQPFAPEQGAPSSSSTASKVSGRPNSPSLRKTLTTFPRVSGIEHWSSADSSTVVFDLDDPVPYEIHRLAPPERIYFDLHGTELIPALAGRPIKVGDALLNRIRVAQVTAGTTRIVLETKTLSDVSVRIEQNPYRMVVELHKSESHKGTISPSPTAAHAEKN